ncbi:MAG: hypothetical protein A2Y33_16375 [Spirochaetes bacterium GWF1_51_8]|nr:MAG: hypothetical protein A2Y33_16375 [Spirochaetes bacterium GWF1_51_8]
MEYRIRLEIEHLPEGFYVAVSPDLEGLTAQGRTIAETVEIAQDVAKKIIESYIEHGDSIPSSLKPAAEKMNLDVTVGV